MICVIVVYFLCCILCSPKWAFLFDKVMLLCKKVTRLGFDVRYSPKHVFTVSTLSVSHVPQTSTKPTKVSCYIVNGIVK